MNSAAGPMQKIRIVDVAWPNTQDIDLDRHLDVPVLDSHVKRCAAAATSSLKTPPAGYSPLQAAHLSWMFDAMRFTHTTIRNLVAKGVNSPECVDAVALARMQLEALYSVCLLVQGPSFVDIYVKSFWRDAYVIYLLDREERQGLPRFSEYLNQTALPLMEQLRQASGVTDEEKATVELEELGTPLPTGMQLVKIRSFPTPGSVIGQVTHPERQQMLKRLYPEYKRLCGYAHGSAQSWMTKTAFWERSPLRRFHTEGEREKKYLNDVAELALFFSFFPVVQSTSELATLYPSDVELQRVAIEAWNLLSEMNLLGKIMWEVRGRTSLGVI
jgi:hypothetical protein